MRSPLADIIRASAVYRSGGVFAYPAEAVWGFAGNPFCERSVRRVAEIKRRRVQKPLLLVASSPYYFSKLVDRAVLQEHRAIGGQWPGPYTWVFPASASAPRHLVAADNTIALRWSSDSLVAQLCAHVQGPLFSTSANNAGEPPLREEVEVRARFGVACDFIVSGVLGVLGQPTPIRQARTGKYLRR